MDDLIKRQDALKVSSMDSGIYIGINNLPPVDAVEVVRCGECKNRFNGEHHDNCCDVLMEKVKWTFEVTVEPDWFCADGERRTDG